MTLLVLVDNVERTEHHLQSVRRSPVNIVGQAVPIATGDLKHRPAVPGSSPED